MDIPCPRLMLMPGAGIERRLVRGGEKHAGVRPEYILGTIAVMHIEIDNRHAGKPVSLQRMKRANGGIGKKAEPHRRGFLRVMPRRAGGAENRLCLPFHHHIHRQPIGPCGAARGGEGAGGHMRIRIQRHMAFIRGGSLHLLKIAFGMGAENLFIRRQRGLDPLDLLQAGRIQRLKDSGKPFNALRMAGRRDVGEAIGVRDYLECHGRKIGQAGGEVKYPGCRKGETRPPGLD